MRALLVGIGVLLGVLVVALVLQATTGAPIAAWLAVGAFFAVMIVRWMLIS